MDKTETAGAGASATRHCDTCTCDDASALATFNARCQRLIRDGSVRLSTPMSVELATRISAHPQFAFGFREFMADQRTRLVAAVFLVGVHPARPKPEDADAVLWRQWRSDHRFFGVVIPNPLEFGASSRLQPRPFEYKPGDTFDVIDSPRGEDFDEIASWSDERIAAWLTESLDTLHTFVERAIGGGESSCSV